jgi:hypothetical protein
MPVSILYILQVLSVGHNDSNSIRRDTTHQPNKTNTQLTILEYVVILDILISMYFFTAYPLLSNPKNGLAKENFY